MYRTFPPVLALVALLVSGASACRGDVTLPAIFGDNMVIERETDFAVWGRADADESVTVQLGPDTQQTTAGTDGKWQVKMDGLKAGGPYDMTVSGKNSVVIHNVAVGEVWVCAGESNMEYPVIAARNGPEEMAKGDLPMARMFVVKHAASEKPADDCEGSWVVCSPGTVKDLSAVGYFFAHELNPAMRTPMGIIESAWGPSPAVAWTPQATLNKDPDLRAAVDRYAKATVEYPEKLNDYQVKLEAWKAAAATAKAAGSPAPRKPLKPLEPGGQREPSALYNGMILPLVNYPIRGVLWWQGESDTSDPGLYRKLLPAMIGAWRTAWGEDFPFLYVQLAGFMGKRAQPAESRWAELREAQAQALSTPKTGMAVSADTSEEYNMHPADKQDVAHRLALLAESIAYGKGGVAASGPVFSGMEVEDGKAVLTFAHADGGLAAGNGGNGTELTGFAIAGEDRNFVWANAVIRGDKVVVSSKDVASPVAVRYGWADYPNCNLFNGEHLPASPFRTDAWTVGEAAAATPAATPKGTPGTRRHRHRRVVE